MVSTPPYTAYLKIAEGCDNHCAYCIIPSLRGRYRSRSMESLLAEAKGLADSGVRELVVVAQDITRYGTDRYHKRMLGALLTELCKLDFHWIRLHYLYPDELDAAVPRPRSSPCWTNCAAVCPDWSCAPRLSAACLERERPSLRSCANSCVR